MTTTSIADVECKHAQSQRWSDRPFPTIVAKHINAEFRAHKLEARAKAESSCQGNVAPAAVGDSNQSENALVTVHEKPKQLRRKPAYMHFRDDLLRAEKSCTDQTLNPCSKDFWQTLKKKFNELSPSMRAY